MYALTRLLVWSRLMFALVACNTPPAPADIAATDPATPPHTGALPAQRLSSGAVYADRLSPALEMNTARAAHTATLLADGRVLILGGFHKEGTSEVAIASAEIYDPKTNRFIPAGNLNEPRSGHTATLLHDGTVLIVGGWGLRERLSTAELFDPATGEFRHTASMVAPLTKQHARPWNATVDGRLRPPW